MVQANKSTTNNSLAAGSLIPAVETPTANVSKCLPCSGKRSLSASREKQSPRIAKALRRPCSSPMSLESSQEQTQKKKTGLPKTISKASSPMHSHCEDQERGATSNTETANVVSMVILPKLSLVESSRDKGKDATSSILKHKIVKRTTATSIKRSAVSSAKVVRKRKSIE